MSLFASTVYGEFLGPLGKLLPTVPELPWLAIVGRLGRSPALQQLHEQIHNPRIAAAAKWLPVTPTLEAVGTPIAIALMVIGLCWCHRVLRPIHHRRVLVVPKGHNGAYQLDYPDHSIVLTVSPKGEVEVTPCLPPR